MLELCNATFSGPLNRNIDFNNKCVTVRSQSGNAAVCIINCEALGRGFHFYHAGNEPLVENISIVNGNATEGGGIYCINDSSPTIIGCVISGNYASNDGGGIYSPDLSIDIIGCTISGNGAYSDGGGIYGRAYIASTILWGNCVETGLGDEWLRLGCMPVSCCDDLGAGIERPRDCWYNCGLGPNISEDPLFCDPEDCLNAPTDGGDYHLRTDSPCADAPSCGQIGALGVYCLSACCDISTGVCTDVLSEAECTGLYEVFTPYTACEDLDPNCAILRGACCNDSTGACQTDVNIADCLGNDRDGSTGGRVAPWSDNGGPTRFIPDGACGAFYPPYGQGACCYWGGNPPGGTVADCSYEDEATCEARPDFISFTYVGVCPGDIDLADPNQEPPAFEIWCPYKPVPTLSEWGLIIMALLMLTAGTVVFGRRRRPAAAYD